MLKVSEKQFETEIVEYMTTYGGWQPGKSSNFNPYLALDTVELMAWIKDTQPEKWKELSKRRNGDVEARFVERVAQELDNRGTIDVLRHGVTDLGVEFKMCQFKPANVLNKKLVEDYSKNRLVVTRQLYFSPNTNESLDIALFINGVPVATAELKDLLTNQTVNNAVLQYKARDHKQKIFEFKSRALVHFAVDPNEVKMTTRLSGNQTRFMPFNLGDNGGKGNPENPHGYKTEYLWKEVWQRDSWLNILANYVHIETKKKRRGTKTVRSESVIFPRYHQLDAVTKLLRDVQSKGPGEDYLIQHSAGSGKSITIAWLAHRLSKLHDASGQKAIFDSVIIVTDRLVLDQQLQETVYQIEHVHGVVKKIDESSKQLAEALEHGTKIIVTTLQKFPFVMDYVDKLPARNYAVIVDEAHSSQTGENARQLRAVLSPHTPVEDLDEEGLDVEKAIAEYARTRNIKQMKNLSYFAFTATPRRETLEIFGTEGADGKPYPFHLYSMRQAIEEEFILDVLKNYTTYKTYYKILQIAQEDPDVDKRKAARAMARFAELHPYNLSQKAEIIIEHFRNNTMKQIGGRAKAMVVTGSRLHAVRYKKAFDRYIKEKGYTDVGVLVAFTGDVQDEGGPYSEKNMNDLRGLGIRDAFDTDEYNVLLVAEKFQTGFDQPLLQTMYVDKKLSGLKAVQTLSRLNRMHLGKDKTFVLDFVNDPEEIQKAFAEYYEGATIETPTDLNQVYDLKSKMDAIDVYRWEEVEQYAELFFVERPIQSMLHKILDMAVARFGERDEEKQQEFRSYLSQYLKSYEFVSQILPYQDIALEKLYAYGRALRNKLPSDTGGGLYDLEGDIELQYYRINKISQGTIPLDKGKPLPDPGTGEVISEDDELTPLSQVIERFNERFGTDFSKDDKIPDLMEESILAEDSARKGAQVNTMGAYEVIFNEVFESKIFEIREQSKQFFDLLVENDEAREYWRKVLLRRTYERFNKESGEVLR